MEEQYSLAQRILAQKFLFLLKVVQARRLSTSVLPLYHKLHIQH